MSLTRRNDIFNDLFNFGIASGPNLEPRANISTGKSGILVEVELPGYSKSDIGVDAKNGMLTITASRSDIKREYHQREFGHASVQRSWSIPRSVDLDRINATYEAGILSVDLPYRVEASETQRKIEIR
jgi:HSP20 family protein